MVKPHIRFPPGIDADIWEVELEKQRPITRIVGEIAEAGGHLEELGFDPERGPCPGTQRWSAKQWGMPIPEFIVELRRHVGHAPLWLPAVTAVVIRAQQVLLVKRCDNRAWTPVTGIVEPGENPADCAVREVLEETGIRVVARRLAWVHVTRPTVHANGDHAQYLDHVFRMDWAAGEPFPADEESVCARWFDLSTVPQMSADMRRRIKLASDDSRSTDTVFDTRTPDIAQ